MLRHDLTEVKKSSYLDVHMYFIHCVCMFMFMFMYSQKYCTVGAE